MKRYLTAAALILCVTEPALAATGETVAVVQRAIISSNGEKSTLDVGRQVQMGDTIATGEGGEAQIIFPDETRIVVGPNSQLTISNLLFRDTGVAERLSVNAVRGTFRFLSGKSPHKAYSIKTPTATMGVRGTAFDFAVAGANNTDLVVYSGKVRFCAQGRCAAVPSGCQVVSIDRKGEFKQPKTVGERRVTLDASFPYAEAQDQLKPVFQTETASCKDGKNVALPVRLISLPGPVTPSSDGGTPSVPETGNPAD